MKEYEKLYFFNDEEDNSDYLSIVRRVALTGNVNNDYKIEIIRINIMDFKKTRRYTIENPGKYLARESFFLTEYPMSKVAFDLYLEIAEIKLSNKNRKNKKGVSKEKLELAYEDFCKNITIESYIDFNDVLNHFSKDYIYARFEKKYENYINEYHLHEGKEMPSQGRKYTYNNPSHWPYSYYETKQWRAVRNLPNINNENAILQKMKIIHRKNFDKGVYSPFGYTAGDSNQLEKLYSEYDYYYEEVKKHYMHNIFSCEKIKECIEGAQDLNLLYQYQIIPEEILEKQIDQEEHLFFIYRYQKLSHRLLKQAIEQRKYLSEIKIYQSVPGNLKRMMQDKGHEYSFIGTMRSLLYGIKDIVLKLVA